MGRLCTGPHSHLVVACHMFRWENQSYMVETIKFKMSLERSLLCESLNKQSFQYIMLFAYLLGSCEDVSYEHYMILTTATSSRAVSESEEESMSH